MWPVLAVATAAIALAAAIAVPRLSADEVARDQPAIAAASPVTRDGLRLAPLPGWSAPPTVPSLPGLGFTAPIVLKEPISGMMLMVGLLPAMSRTLVPPDLEERLQAPLGRPDTVVLEHGFEAYHYPRVTLSGTSSALDLYLIPTTAGVVTAACVAAPGRDDGGAPYYECWKNLATLRLLESGALRLGSDAAFRQRLPAAVAQIDAERATVRPASGEQDPRRAGGRRVARGGGVRASGRRAPSPGAALVVPSTSDPEGAHRRG